MSSESQSRAELSVQTEDSRSRAPRRTAKNPAFEARRLIAAAALELPGERPLWLDKSSTESGRS
jgi:hypothetical protein